MTNKLFVVIGMPRGGTTFLYHNLKKHPNIFLPYRKEVNYFNVNFKKGEKWYHSLYKEANDNQIKGDISPPCFLDRESVDKILSYNADVKCILVVRNPADYAVSFYEQFDTFVYDLPPFETFLKKGYEYKIANQILNVTFSNNYVKDTIELFMQKFGKNLLIYDFNLLKTDTIAVLKHIEAFLELPNHFDNENFDDMQINSGDRGNIKFLQKILSDENVITVIEKMFPRSFIIKMRSYYDIFSSKLKPKKTDINTQAIKEKNKKMAQEFLQDDIEWYINFFKYGQVKLGDGTIITQENHT